MMRVFVQNKYLSICLTRLINKAASAESGNYVSQIDYVKTVTSNNVQDWSEVKQNILNKAGNINQKNIDGTLLKLMLTERKFDIALSFANHLNDSSETLPIGTINGLLALYYELGKENMLTDKHRLFILDTYDSLYKKYDALDYTTAERLLHALCAIDEHTKAFNVLNDIYLSGTPTHSALSTLVATLFRINKNNEALDLIDRSLNHKRPLLDTAYEEWIKFILRKYESKDAIQRHLDDICSLISKNCLTVSQKTAERIGNTYTAIGWNFQSTQISRSGGQCKCCKQKLKCLKLTNEEFDLLQKNVKQKLIIGSDLFLKTSPDEIKRFVDFVENTAPYDIVLDALNIAFAVGKGSQMNKLEFLEDVVNHFLRHNKKILLLGRKHMLKWPKNKMQSLMKKTNSFFTDNLSEDDPYFITAAILSGPNTDIVSKDLLRTHRFQLKDEQLRGFFQRWQWAHQWMVFINWNKKPNIQAPLTFTPCAQKTNGGWHLPYDKEELNVQDINKLGRVNDGVPDLSTWMCLKPCSVGA